MKRFVLQLICLFTANTMLADDNQHLCVLLKSGMVISVAIRENPKITFDGTVMRVGNDDYQIENVSKWMVGDPETILGLSATQKDAQGTIVYNDGVLKVGSQKDVHIYNSAGIEMPVELINGQVNMSSWPHNVYLIKVGTETLKILKP